MRPPDTDLLIAGGGLAAQRCCETVRRLGYEGRIVMLCEEPTAPYDRPPLSKAMLTGELPPRQLELKPAPWYGEHGVELLLGASARELDPAQRTILISQSRGAGGDRTLRYRQLVIATGSRPRRLPALGIGGAVHELRTRADALALRSALREGQGRLGVLGAGLIGMEVAAAARALGWNVTLIEAATTPLARALPPLLGNWIAALHRRHGVEVRLASTVERVTLRGGRARLRLADARTVTADALLVAAGTEPATEWLAGSGIGPGSIFTDATGHTKLPGVYAAGDAACFPDPYLRQRIPTQHWEAAARQGAAVAHAVCGLAGPPPAPAMFWSDQHGHRIQLVGHAPPDGEIELDGDPAEGGPFAAWIRHAGRPTGALLVDRPDVLARARRWIADSQPHSTNELPRAA